MLRHQQIIQPAYHPAAQRVTRIVQMLVLFRNRWIQSHLRKNVQDVDKSVIVVVAEI